MMELINCNSWKSLADYVYDSPSFGEPPQDSIVHVPMDHMAKFCREDANWLGGYTVISSCSDFGFAYQHINPVWADMKKWLDFIPISENLGYNPLISPARCVLEQCKITERLSIKCHSFTIATMAEMNEGIRQLYATNFDISHGEGTAIPFGIPDWSQELITIARSQGRHKNEKRKIGVYVNFQNNTAERVHLKRQLKNQDWFTVIDDEISHEDYINNLLNSYYVLAPCGNGLDCYRILEALYCGATPIITNGYWANAYNGLPVVKLENYNKLMPYLHDNGFKMFEGDLDGTRADFQFWRQQINDSRKDSVS